MQTSKLLPILLLILLILPLTSAAAIQTKNNDYISSFSSGSSFEYKDLWSWQQLVGLNDPSPMDFIAVIAEAFVQLFSGNVPGFLSLAVLSSPFIGIFVLLFMMGHFVGSITLFRSEDHAHYRKYFGWGLALIGISTNKTFSIIYNFLGRLFTSIAFTLLFFFGIWMLMSHMRKRTLENSTENYKLKQEQLQLQKEGLTDEKEANELEKIAKKDKDLVENEINIEKREMMVLVDSLNIIRTFYDAFKSNKFLASLKLNTIDWIKVKASLDDVYSKLKTNLESYENYLKETFKLESLERAEELQEAKLSQDLKTKILKLINKYSQKKESTNELSEILTMHKELEKRLKDELAIDKKDWSLIQVQHNIIVALKSQLNELEKFKNDLGKTTKSEEAKIQLNSILPKIFNQFKLAGQESKTLYGFIVKKEQIEVIINQETSKIETKIKDVEQKLNSI
jgi:uncharacterized protein (DUF2062 family)